VSVQDENEYEDLLGLWSDLESGLGILLGNPLSVQEFEQRIWQYDRWMKTLIDRDTDLGLYLLFQLAANSSVGYSAAHALVCATLSDLVAKQLALPQGERDSLVHAALTMNIAMTGLQDELALQVERLSPAQLETIRLHPAQGAAMLQHHLGVTDDLWIEIVSTHHDEYAQRIPLVQLTPVQRLSRILKVIDRYAAMISPRKSREGRSAPESVRTVMTGANAYNDEVGHALIRAVGLCPPGTFVTLDDKTLAIVVRRSDRPNQPHVAVVTTPDGQILAYPRLHRATDGPPAIMAALTTSVVRLRLNHHLILQLGARVLRPRQNA